MPDDVKAQVLSIVADLENGRPCESCTDCGADLNDETTCPECEAENPETMNGFEYVSDVLDVDWVLDQNRGFKGARLLVAFGGPNIWVNTDRQTVEGYWLGNSFTASYNRDAMDVNHACAEWFEAGA